LPRPLDRHAGRQRDGDEAGGAGADGLLDDLVGAARGREDEARGGILAGGCKGADELVERVVPADVCARVADRAGLVAEGGGVRGAGAAGEPRNRP
jgi:hypothetical protein